MVDVIFDLDFKRKFKKIKNKALKEKIIKHISKIKHHPTLGKPMRYGRRGTREIYIAPFRLSYMVKSTVIYVLDLYHKKKQ